MSLSTLFIALTKITVIVNSVLNTVTLVSHPGHRYSLSTLYVALTRVTVFALFVKEQIACV